MWVNHLCLISEFRDVEEYIKKNLVTDKFTVVIHGEGHWWCKALFIRAIMWVNHLCLIFEFWNVEEFFQKNLALTNSQSLFMERMMVQSFLRFICQLPNESNRALHHLCTIFAPFSFFERNFTTIKKQVREVCTFIAFFDFLFVLF